MLTQKPASSSTQCASPFIIQNTGNLSWMETSRLSCCLNVTNVLLPWQKADWAGINLFLFRNWIPLWTFSHFHKVTPTKNQNVQVTRSRHFRKNRCFFHRGTDICWIEFFKSAAMMIFWLWVVDMWRPHQRVCTYIIPQTKKWLVTTFDPFSRMELRFGTKWQNMRGGGGGCKSVIVSLRITAGYQDGKIKWWHTSWFYERWTGGLHLSVLLIFQVFWKATMWNLSFKNDDSESSKARDDETACLCRNTLHAGRGWGMGKVTCEQIFKIQPSSRVRITERTYSEKSEALGGTRTSTQHHVNTILCCTGLHTRYNTL